MSDIHCMRETSATLFSGDNNRPQITLTDYEQMMAGSVGFRRQFKAMQRNSEPLFSEKYSGQLWWNHIAGACAELAVAKFLGLYWGGGVDTFNREDIEGTGYEVRCSPSGKPKVRPRDTRIIVAVICNAPSIKSFVILGWLRADEAKRKEWESSDQPLCYFPPADAWHPIRQLSSIMAMRTRATQEQGDIR